MVPESRELDLFAAMLEAEGARVLRCPLVKILDLEDISAARNWIARVIAGEYQDIIWLTGEGLRRLTQIAEHMQCKPAFIAALGRVRNITRGPKPGRALRELGLSPGLTAATPTSQGVLDALAPENLKGRRIGVQIYPGDGAMPLLANLFSRGATAHPVTPYRYAPQSQIAEVSRAIRSLADGEVGLIIFTATPQVERLLQVAQQNGLEQELAAGLARTPVAAIGPVVEDTLRQQGIAVALRPESSFHLKPLLRAIVNWRKA